MIGFLDSGFGGLTTLRKWLQIAPEYDTLYLGDSARSPYGNRSVEVIRQYADEGVRFLFEQGATIVLLACNTISADALRYLQHKYPKKTILGVLIPAVEEALSVTRFGRIGVIGTRGTITSRHYEKEILKREHLYIPTDRRAHATPRITTVAAPLLVPLVEEGWIQKPETRMIVKKYLLSLKYAHVDTLVLGCTHYSLLEAEFIQKMGSQCHIVNSGDVQAKSLVQYLIRHPQKQQPLSQNSIHQFFTTDCPMRFQEIGSAFLGRKISKKSLSHIELS